MIRSLFKKSWFEGLGSFAAEKLQFPQGAVLLTHVPSKLIRDERIPYIDRCLIKAFGTRSIWPCDRLWRAGYVVDRICRNCGIGCGTVFHGSFGCEATEELTEGWLKPSVLSVLSDGERNWPLLLGFLCSAP